MLWYLDMQAELPCISLKRCSSQGVLSTQHGSSTHEQMQETGVEIFSATLELIIVEEYILERLAVCYSVAMHQPAILFWKIYLWTVKRDWYNVLSCL